MTDDNGSSPSGTGRDEASGPALPGRELDRTTAACRLLSTAVARVDATIVRDVVIVLPGIMGSELWKGDDPVWSMRPGSIIASILTLGRGINKVRLPAGIGDGEPDDGVEARSTISTLHVIPGLWSPIDGYDGLLNFLRGERFHLVERTQRQPDVMPNLIEFAYDWRLSNGVNAKRLKAVADTALDQWRAQPGFGDAKLVLIGHSMGGLVARRFLENEGGAADTRALITIGTPHRGAAMAIDALANGIKKGIGALSVDLTDFARSLPSLYELLPTYDAVVMTDGSRRALLPEDPGLDTDMVRRAAAFHDEITAASASRPQPYRHYKVVGTRQPTATTATLRHESFRVLEEIDGHDQGGDGTVPRLSSQPFVDGAPDDDDVHGLNEKHGSMQLHRSTFDVIDEVLTREEIIWQDGGGDGLAVRLDELWLTTDEPELTVVDPPDRRLRVTILDEHGDEAAAPVTVDAAGSAVLPRLPPGGYLARVGATTKGGPPPVSSPFLIWDPT